MRDCAGRVLVAASARIARTETATPLLIIVMRPLQTVIGIIHGPSCRGIVAQARAREGIGESMLTGAVAGCGAHSPTATPHPPTAFTPPQSPPPSAAVRP